MSKGNNMPADLETCIEKLEGSLADLEALLNEFTDQSMDDLCRGEDHANVARLNVALAYALNSCYFSEAFQPVPYCYLVYGDSVLEDSRYFSQGPSCQEGVGSSFLVLFSLK